jgi:hypothetical protein
MHPLTVSASRCGFFSSSNCSHAYFLRAHAPRAPTQTLLLGPWQLALLPIRFSITTS